MDALIKMFNDHKVRYLVIGGQAVRLEGMPRFSMDWDFFIPPKDKGNIEKINSLLADVLDIPLTALGPKGEGFVQTFQTPWGIVQFHLGGVGLPDFARAEAHVVEHQTEDGTPVKCMGLKDLLESKRGANRPQDQADIRFLEAKLGLDGHG